MPAAPVPSCPRRRASSACADGTTGEAGLVSAVDPPASAHGIRGTSPPRAEIPWHPSRWLLAILAAMTLLAPLAVLASEMPRTVAWPLALVALAHGVALLRREARRPPCVFVFAGGGAPVLLDGRAVEGVALHWRGPLAFLRWRDPTGGTRRLAWWPDTLPPPRRRELRLAAPAPKAARRGASMAP